ncbi:hypothetical protein [Lonepinella sp. MS14437]|uniref:lipase family protein n=1 Tax=Lonepinella sp. MS14437 TaxID=3003620 RepID=UPI0036DF1406
MAYREKDTTKPINECKYIEYTLWLKHTEQYNYINAYNLAYLARLAYSRVIIDNKSSLTNDFQGFINRAKIARWSCSLDKDWNKIKTTRITDDGESKLSNAILTPFIELVDIKEGIQYPNKEKVSVGYVDNKKTSVAALFYSDEERAVIAVRGTHEIWHDGAIIDADAKQVLPEVPDVKIYGKVHQGFYTQALAIIKEPNFGDFVSNIGNKKLFLTGHSLGGAVATILSAYLSERGLKPLLYTYGSPRVGDVNFVKAYNDKFVHFRHVNDGDTVPGVPGRELNGNVKTLAKDMMLSSPLLNTALQQLNMLDSFALKNLTGDLYTHHGNLCQFINDGTHVVMLPFFYNEITQISLKDKGIKEIKTKSDRVHSLTTPSMHSLDKYLLNIEKTIIELYRFYRNKNNKHLSPDEVNDIKLFQDFIDEQIAKTENEIKSLRLNFTGNVELHAFASDTATEENIMIVHAIEKAEKIKKLYSDIHNKLIKIGKNGITTYDLYAKIIPVEDIQYQLDYLLKLNG